MTRHLTCALAMVLVCSAGTGGRAAADNAVLRWNSAALDAFRVTREPPMRAARALAILHTCIYDAWAPYRHGGHAATGRSRAHGLVALSAAAHTALVDLFPAQRQAIFDPLLRELDAVEEDLHATKRDAAATGRAVCDAVLEARHHDGANQLGDLNGGAPYSDYTGYVPVNTPEMLADPNRWQPLRTPSGAAQTFVAPHWGLVTPYALQPASQFRPPPPALAGSLEYLQQAQDILSLHVGLDDRSKAIAIYWADGPGTDTPPGHWHRLAQWVSRRDGHDVDDDVRLFFLLGNAMLDASVAVWDAKRFYDSERPISAIRHLFPAQAGFVPYLPTPAFAEHPSGHSAFSAAAARVLERFTGSAAFGARAVVPAGSSFVDGVAPARDVVLAWRTFADAADQAGLSRRYGGIHFEAGDLRSRQLGRQVADQVWRKAAPLLGLEP
ncbi:MAG TPA: hypothetical protein VFO31_02085 [Vicinamibacterales bacterium]|nr:hypothetical protein [Vicinamibacterales bacterium]